MPGEHAPDPDPQFAANVLYRMIDGRLPFATAFTTAHLNTEARLALLDECLVIPYYVETQQTEQALMRLAIARAGVMNDGLGTQQGRIIIGEVAQSYFLHIGPTNSTYWFAHNPVQRRFETIGLAAEQLEVVGEMLSQADFTDSIAASRDPDVLRILARELKIPQVYVEDNDE